MTEYIRRVGIGVELSVSPVNLGGLRSELESHKVQTIDDDKLHITAVEPIDASLWVYEKKDSEEIDRAVDAIRQELGSACLSFAQLSPDTEGLNRYGSNKRKVGFDILEQAWLGELVGKISSVVEEETGILPIEFGNDAHLVLGMLGSDFYKRRKWCEKFSRSFKLPQDVHINGFRVYTQDLDSAQKRTPKQKRGQNTRYRNQTAFVRRVA